MRPHLSDGIPWDIQWASSHERRFITWDPTNCPPLYPHIVVECAHPNLSIVVVSDIRRKARVVSVVRERRQGSVECISVLVNRIVSDGACVEADATRHKTVAFYASWKYQSEISSVEGGGRVCGLLCFQISVGSCIGCAHPLCDNNTTKNCTIAHVGDYRSSPCDLALSGRR